MLFSAFIIFSLSSQVNSANSTTQVLSMDEHIEKLKSLESNLAEYINKPFPGLALSINHTNSTFKVVLVAGIHSGYLKNQDFLYEAVNSIQASLSESSFASKCSFCKFYLFPVFNQPAHNALYETYNATKALSVFKTDMTGLGSCNNSKDAGVNPNHNFDVSSEEESYSDTCSSNYSGTEMIEMVKSFADFIDDESPAIVIHLHRDTNSYIKAFTNSTEKDAGYVALANQKISEILPKGITLKNNFEAFGEVEFGTLIDFCAKKEKLAVQIGLEDSFEDHLKFIYSAVDLALPKYQVKVRVDAEAQKNSSSSNNETSEEMQIVLVEIEIQVLNAVSLKNAALILRFDSSFDDLETIYCKALSQSDYRKNEEDCSEYFKLMKETVIHADLPAFGKFKLEANVSAIAAAKNEGECLFTVFAEGLFDPVKAKCGVSDEDDESEDSSDSNPSDVIKMTTKTTYIISASMVLIFLNVLLVLVGVWWNFKNN